jgi:hypothetical protein
MSSFFNFLQKNAFPSRFYKVQRKPKASAGVMALVSSVVYFIVTCAFAGILYSQSQIRYTETTISTTDISGSSGYSCSMASIYNSAPEELDDTDPAPYYQLINVNEMKRQCMSELAAEDPCNQPYLYSPGPSSAQNKYIISASSYGDNFVSLVIQTDPPQLVYSIFEYNIADGSLTETVNSAIMGLSGVGPEYFSLVARQYDNITFYVTNNAVATPGYEEQVFPSYGSVEIEILMIANDNLFNIYVVGTTGSNGYRVYKLQTTFNQSSWYANATVLSDDMIGAEYETFSSFAVFCYENRLMVFFVSGGDIYRMDIVGTSTTQKLLWVPSLTSNYEYVQVSMDGSRLFAALSYEISVSGVSTIYGGLVSLNASSNGTAPVNLPFVPAASCFMSEIASSSAIVTGFSVISGDFILGSCYLAQYDLASGGMILYDTANLSYASILVGFVGTSTGWFSCDGQLQSAFPPNLITGTGSANCSTNGILWRATYASSMYYTAAAMHTTALSTANRSCSQATYESICDRIGDLPPYICSRQQGQPRLTMLSTALANCSLLFLVLTVTLSTCLPKISRFLSPESTNELEVRLTDGALQMHSSV